MLYKVNVCPQETLTVSHILLKVNLPWYLEPAADSDEILFVADMKILGGGVGRRYKMCYLLKPISYTPAPGASHRG